MTILIPQPLTDSKAFRTTLGCFPTGVAIVTTLSETGAPVGLTISSFNSVSLAPPLILWSLAQSSECLDDFQARRGFAINILSADQTDLCNRFASAHDDRFDGISWAASAEGLPVLKDIAAVLICETHAVHDGGDHEIYLGKVMSHAGTKNTPMVYANGAITRPA